MACCSSCAQAAANGTTGMCNQEKWAMGVLVAAFLLLVYISLS